MTDVGIRLDAPKDNRNALEWHQDSSYYRQNESGKNGVVVWSPLIQDITLEMGPLEFLRRSQNIGTLMTPKKKVKMNYSPEKYLLIRIELRNISKMLLVSALNRETLY